MMEQKRIPSPELFFNTVNAYQRTAILKAAIELGVFGAIGKGAKSASEIAESCGASTRGIRILCDNLVIIGFLTKEQNRYSQTEDSAFFMDQNSPDYIGGAIQFLLSPVLTDAFSDLAGVVRKGGTIMEDGGTVAAAHPIWAEFARAMAPLAQVSSSLVADLILQKFRPKKVLDLAAGHGLYGIEIANRNPECTVTAVDWPNVLEVARGKAEAQGVSDRYHLLPGSAFTVEFGSGYDTVLITNFLHHFDPPVCGQLLRKVHAALAKGGHAVTLEFIPNEDRITPPTAAAFSMIMLASTEEGDAYTYNELDSMFREAGFARNELHPLPPTFQQVVLSYK